MISCNVSVTICVNRDCLACIIAMGGPVIMLGPQDVSIGGILDRRNIIVGTCFDTLSGDISVSRRIERDAIGKIVVICGTVVSF